MLQPTFLPRTSFLLTRRIFLKCLAIVYLIAFVSIGVQVLGLYGSDGILPVQELLNAVAKKTGIERYWLLPSVFWLNAGDAALTGAWVLGCGFSGLFFLNVAPRISLLGAWFLYLSYSSVGREFMSFQWDALLLETGLLALFLAPGHWLPKKLDEEAPPAPAAVWLIRALFFKLMFSSGVVKLASGDPSWANLTALTYHYFSQCIPHAAAWYIHQFPLWFHKLSCFFMFTVELVGPFGMFLGWRGRAAAFAGNVLLQLIVLATGNYNFFNLLTITLCVSLLDDGLIARMLKIGTAPAPGPSRPGWDGPGGTRSALSWQNGITLIFMLVYVLISFGHFVRMPVLRPLEKLVDPLNSINRYGLFAVMTKERPEIILEGSDDGREWKEYEFKWKPGDVKRAPGFCIPHQPRLDWQMWFAALGSYRYNAWLLRFMEKLLEGSKPVLALLGKNPFPDHPPKYVRAVLYDYKFTTWAERRETKAWWKREVQGLYCPVLRRQ